MFRRSAFALITVILGSTVLASSVSALGSNGGAIKGIVGEYGGPVYPEVTCRYNDAGRLSSMRVRPLTLHGSHDQLTYVGYQVVIRQATEFQAGRLIFKSPIARQLASKTVASSFGNRNFAVTEDLDGAQAYYVSPKMLFFSSGSRTDVEGKGTLLYDGYLQKRGTVTFWSNACTFDFGQIWEGD
jgi:hypothetical protein